VEIRNAGSVDVENLFFVDIFIDPRSVSPSGIPLTESAGYTAVNGLPGGASRTLEIAAPRGFANQPPRHLVFAMVDSVEQIAEADETNNLSPPLLVEDVTPGFPPIFTPEPPDGDFTISGVARALLREWLPQFRAQVRLTDQATGETIATTVTDRNGFYAFRSAPPGVYSVRACMTIDNRSYSGVRAGVTVPDLYADIFMLPGPCQP
jgi:hypothetical protein